MKPALQLALLAPAILVVHTRAILVVETDRQTVVNTADASDPTSPLSVRATYFTGTPEAIEITVACGPYAATWFTDGDGTGGGQLVAGQIPVQFQVPPQPQMRANFVME